MGRVIRMSDFREQARVNIVQDDRPWRDHTTGRPIVGVITGSFTLSAAQAQKLNEVALGVTEGTRVYFVAIGGGTPMLLGRDLRPCD